MSKRFVVVMLFLAGAVQAASSFTPPPETGVALTRAAPANAGQGVNVASANGDTVSVMVTFSAQSGVTLAGGPVDCWYRPTAVSAWSRLSSADLTIPNSATRYWTSEPVPMPTTGWVYYAPRGVTLSGATDGGNTLSIWYQFTVGMAGSAGAPHFSSSSSGGGGAVTGTFWQSIQPVSGTVNCSLVDAGIALWPATQPVSGTVTANMGTGFPMSDAGQAFQVNGTSQATASVTEVLVTASDGGSCVTLPTTKNRRGIAIQNLGPNVISCLPGACPASIGRGWNIPAVGGNNVLALDVNDMTVLRCWAATANQIADGGTMVLEY